MLNVKVVSHKDQRYDTSGDWWWNGEQLEVRVSNLNDWRYHFLIAIHEVVEACFCKFNRLDQNQVTEFDKQFLEGQKVGKYKEWEEPGDDPSSPYHLGHCLAISVERALAFMMCVNWKTYNEAVISL